MLNIKQKHKLTIFQHFNKIKNMKKYFEVVAKYDKEQDNGSIKTVNELYIIDAVNHGEAEERATKELSQQISGEFSVKAVKESKIVNIYDAFLGKFWYKVKISFSDIDQKSGKEKVSNEIVLVSANDTNQAISIIIEKLSAVLVPWRISAITETKIIDVFYYTMPEIETV